MRTVSEDEVWEIVKSDARRFGQSEKQFYERNKTYTDLGDVVAYEQFVTPNKKAPLYWIRSIHDAEEYTFQIHVSVKERARYWWRPVTFIPDPLLPYVAESLRAVDALRPVLTEKSE